MIHAFKYNTLTGQLLSQFKVTNADILALQSLGPDQAFNTTVSHWGQYVDLVTEQAVDKADLGAVWDKSALTANGIDVATLSGLPIPCTVYLDDAPHIVVDGTFEFSANDVGEYKIRVDEVQFIAKEWIINAN